MKMARSPMIISILESYLSFFPPPPQKKFSLYPRTDTILIYNINIKNKPADRVILWRYTASLTSPTHPLICILLHFPAEQRTNHWLLLFTSEFLDARMSHSQSQIRSMKTKLCVGKHCFPLDDTNLTNIRTPWWWHSQEVLKHVGDCVLCSCFSTCTVGLKNCFSVPLLLEYNRVCSEVH